MLLNHKGMTVKNTNGIYFNEINFKSWEEYRDFLTSWRNKVKTNDYVFRGHADNSWGLVSTLDRMRPNLQDIEISSWYRSAELHTIERYSNAINIFKGKIDGNGNIIEKLAIMQHYGAASRLLDITFSPFVATFFSLAETKYLDKTKCVWAFPFNVINAKNKNEFNIIDNDDLYKRYNELDITDEYGTDIIGISSYNNMLNERQFHQQGAFFYSMSNKHTIMDLLPKYFGDEDTNLLKLNFKIRNGNDFSYAINDLRSMNLTYSSLFPDLDGYGKETYIDQFISSTYN
jgi:hypothetical protein